MAFLKKEWRAQRIGWIVLLLIVILALIGVFGHGPVSKQEVGEPQTFGASFDRIIRHGAPADLIVSVGSGLQQDSTLTMYLSAGYLESFEILDIIPEPRSSGLRGDVVYYEFGRIGPPAPAQIIFHLRPQGYWRTRGTITIAGAAPLDVAQFILP